MGYSNDMSKLLKKIERRLGLAILLPHLPESLNMDSWVEVIKEDTLPTFSRYYPNKLRYIVNSKTTIKKNGIYYLNDDIIGDNKVLGIMDIDWTDYSSENISASQINPYGYYLPNVNNCMMSSMNDLIGSQLMADATSLYSNQISAYIDFHYPNSFEIKGAGNININMDNFILNVLVEHTNIYTISPTKMEIFEALAIADVASYLYKNLKYFDGLSTVYADVDLKLSDISDEASRRSDIIAKIEDSYVSTSNDNIPYILTI